MIATLMVPQSSTSLASILQYSEPNLVNSSWALQHDIRLYVTLPALADKRWHLADNGEMCRANEANIPHSLPETLSPHLFYLFGDSGQYA